MNKTNESGDLLFEALALTKMASGHRCLALTARVGWEALPELVEELLRTIDGTVVGKIDASDMRLWKVVIERCEVRLVYDDHPQMVSLESDSDEGNVLLERLEHTLANVLGK